MTEAVPLPFCCGIYIGRFQPPHRAHLLVMQEALTQVQTLLICVGSAGAARSAKNPFTAQERISIIRAMLAEAGVDLGRVQFTALPDHPYDEARWLASVRRAALDLCPTGQPALIGHIKDDSSYYLRSFPEWPFLPTHVESPLSATDVRRALFEDDLGRVSGMVTPAVQTWLTQWRGQPEFARLAAEYAALRGVSPDVQLGVYGAVLRGHQVLLARETGPVGQGLLRLPGGPLRPGLSLRGSLSADLAALATLPGTETALAAAALTVYDAPGRSPAGREVAHVYRVPLAAGADEAGEPWFNLPDILTRPELFWADHHAILEAQAAGGAA
ncbi:adenylyltransferase/cytidyltransferase family protein [Deinococcus lacus]|uniref:Adenylyltransferase/cytidyltransferase family protein n=1 Tax=Deinococcus lacus TaxID=392561 RepID=A0ABW1YD70_9DEIO